MVLFYFGSFLFILSCLRIRLLCTICYLCTSSHLFRSHCQYI